MKNKEFKVGLFSAVALVMLYFGFNYLKGIDFFSSVKKYYAIYDNVDQLAVSNPVLVNGYAVGRVSRIKILQNKQNRVLVELEIDTDIVVNDSTKAILDSDFLGSKSILLNIGSSTKVLKEKDTLRSEVAKGMLAVLSETATPVADNVQTTLRKLNVIIDNLAKNSQQLDAIFAKLQKTPDILNATLTNTNGRIDELSVSFKSVADNLNRTLVDLRPTISNFKTLSDSLSKMKLNETMIKTQQTLTSLNQTLTKLNKGDNTMSKLMTEDTLYVNLNKLLLSLDTLAKNFNDNPGHFLAPLGKKKSVIDRDRQKALEERLKKK